MKYFFQCYYRINDNLVRQGSFPSVTDFPGWEEIEFDDMLIDKIKTDDVLAIVNGSILILNHVGATLIMPESEKEKAPEKILWPFDDMEKWRLQLAHIKMDVDHFGKLGSRVEHYENLASEEYDVTLKAEHLEEVRRLTIVREKASSKQKELIEMIKQGLPS